MPKRTFSIIEKIDKNSFGIYLIHSPLIYITYAYMSDMNPMSVVIMNFVIFGAIAFWITELLRKMHLGVVIGEWEGKRLVSFYEKVYQSDIILSRKYKNRYINEKINIMTAKQTMKYVEKHECLVAGVARENSNQLFSQ